MRAKSFLKHKITLFCAFLLTFPWFYAKCMDFMPPPLFTALISGMCVVGAAFLLAWACETVEMDVPRSLAIAVVALLAILPEYAVDGYLAWMAGQNSVEYAGYTVANMTGANRLLIGIGWSFVILYAIWKRSRTERAVKFKEKTTIPLEHGLRLEVFFLLIATLYAFILPFKGGIDIFDAVVFVSMYIAYIYLCIKSPVHKVEPVGVAEYLCSLPTRTRRATVIFLMIFSAFAILIAVKAFADGLIQIGKLFELDPFLMIQWIAPFASEAPEFLIAFILVAKLKYAHGVNVLISSKVNQWTLLIGTISIIYSISYGSISILPLDYRQKLEVFLTAAQSIFAAAVILNFRFSIVKALLLLALFLIQFAIPLDEVRIGVSLAYVALCIPVFLKYRHEFSPMLRHVASLVK